MAVQNTDLHDFYSDLVEYVDCYNRTHDVQIDSLDFTADVPSEIPFDYFGSLVFKTYNDDTKNERMFVDDFERLQLQDMHRHGRVCSTPWRFLGDIFPVERDYKNYMQGCHREGRFGLSPWYM
ncbi:MAG: hypothetical protein RR061_08740 [Muribaculaceae bacterium]